MTQKNKAAVQLGKLGGEAKNRNLTPEQKKEIGRVLAEARRLMRLKRQQG